MTNDRATGADIIEAMIDNLHAHPEPIYYTAQAPSLYHVYLHAGDFTRLNGIFPQIIGEAKRALDDEMKKLNRKGVAALLRGAVRKRLRPAISYQAPKEGWQIAFYPDAAGELEEGDVAIMSELTATPPTGSGEGNPTTAVRTIKRAEKPSRSEPAQPLTLGPQQPAQAHSAQPTGVTNQGEIYAIIRYSDEQGSHTFQVTKSPLIIGRGGKNVDLKLKTDARVSREHLHLRRDERTGGFYIKDVSAYGVTVNNRRIPGKSGEAERSGIPEVALPERARIVLADVVTLEFESASVLTLRHEK